MSEKIKVYPSKFGTNNINRFALQQAVNQPDVSHEYFLDGRWQNGKPYKKPDDTRIVFDGIDNFRAAKAVYFTWKDLESIMSRERPVFPEEIFKRLRNAYLTRDPLTLFVPWGYRYEGSLSSKECQALQKIGDVQAVLSNRDIPSNVLKMPADLYAKEVNGLDPLSVDRYFYQVEQEANKRGYEVVYWSTIRTENMSDYEAIRRRYTRKELERVLPSYVIDNALIAAKKRCQKGQKESEKSAFNYLVERLCEAEIIEKRFQQVKLSMVSKNKDNGVDLSLPRLYVLPSDLQFPWL